MDLNVREDLREIDRKWKQMSKMDCWQIRLLKRAGGVLQKQ